MRRELLRKLFHLLSLVYLALFLLLGRVIIIRLLGGWIVVVGAVEFLRLRRPALNRWIFKYFRGIQRKEEERRISGVFWTSLGCWLTVFFFGNAPMIVCSAFFYLAFGDAAAAIVGRSLGRVRFTIGGRSKSMEGSLACLAACLASGWAVGLPIPAVIAGAAAATVVELLPVPLDDNLWLPLVSAAVLSLFT